MQEKRWPCEEATLRWRSLCCRWYGVGLTDRSLGSTLFVLWAIEFLNANTELLVSIMVGLFVLTDALWETLLDPFCSVFFLPHTELATGITELASHWRAASLFFFSVGQTIVGMYGTMVPYYATGCFVW